MAFLGEAAEALLDAALGAAEGEAAAAEAADTAATAAKAAVESADAAAEAAAEEAAAKATEAATAAEEAAAKAAAAEEPAMLESKEGIEAAEKAEAEAVQEAENAAKLGEELGPRMEPELGAKMITGIKKVYRYLTKIIEGIGYILIVKAAVEEIPKLYRKVLAGLKMMVAAAVTKLTLLAYKFVRLSGSKDGEEVAKAAKALAADLHGQAGKLIEDSPSKVPINKETHEPQMKIFKQHADAIKQVVQKVTGTVDQLDDELKEYEAILHEGEEKK